MTMNMNEKKALYAFGCPNRKATVERLKLLAALAPERIVTIDATQDIDTIHAAIVDSVEKLLATR